MAAASLPALNIALTITSVTQLEALQHAIDLYCDMEGERAKDGKEAGFTARDKERLDAALALRAIL